MIKLLSVNRCAFVADLHMGDGGPGDDFIDRAALFVRFAEYCYTDNRTLFLVGDTFELHGYRWQQIVSHHAPTFFVLRKLLAENLLKFIIGNHDSEMGIFKGLLPNAVYDIVDVESKDKIIHVEHGHRFDRWNRKPGLWQRAATKIATALERTHKDADQVRRSGLDKTMKVAAGRLLAKKEIDAIVMGHCHHITEEQYKTPWGLRTYYNPGNWGVRATQPHAVMVDDGRIDLCPVIHRREVEA